MYKETFPDLSKFYLQEFTQVVEKKVIKMQLYFTSDKEKLNLNIAKSVLGFMIKTTKKSQVINFYKR